MTGTLLSLVLALAASQDAAPGAQPAAQAPAVILDFLATGSDGKTPADLTAADVELKVGGKVRPLVSLERVDAEGGRHILILADEATLYSVEPVVKEGVGKLLASSRQGDRVRYLSTRNRRTPEVKEALDTMVTGPGVLYTCLSDMVRNIETLTKTLPRGRASTLIVLARGHPEGAAFGNEGAPCTPKREEMRRAAEVVAAAQINVHLVTVSDTTRSWGFETLASNLNVDSRLLTWANTSTLEQIAASTRTFYRATFAPDPGANERPQRVSVNVKRPKIKVETVPSLVIAPSAWKPRTQ